jgi:acetylornithine deacetylase/succinyl-diaminopimelate desuccinylase-like protein
MPVPSDLDSYIAANKSRFMEELFAFLRIPSVSTSSSHNKDTRRAAEWVRASLEAIGLEASLHETARHPVVLGEWRGAPGKPTVLIYGHYDVQPPEPLHLWTSPAFEPTIRDGKIFARGSVDDKGQIYLHIKALEAHLKARGTLPVNVIVIVEGEEEIGSENLEGFIRANTDRLKADVAVVSDSVMFGPGQPSILFALRGLAYFEVNVRGPVSDLHSGSYGGAVVNPATALARMIATLHDEDGRIAIEGFYDSVEEWDPELLESLKELPFDEQHFLKEVGAPALGGEKGRSTLERLWARPTCEVNGLLSGYTGEGAKTVLPSYAMAKISCRLVPRQDPAKIERSMERHLARVAPDGVTVTVEHLHGGRPWKARLDGEIYSAALRALEAAFGREPVLTGEGGSIPVVSDFESILGTPVLLVGFGLPGENAHAPDEWMSVENFEKGILAMAVLWEEYGNKDQDKGVRT